MKRVTHKRLLWYLLSGAVTTLVNFGVYFQSVLYFTPVSSTLLAWFVSVLAAYILNRHLVFPVQKYSFLREIQRAILFLLSRIFSGFTEVVLVYIFIEILDMWALAVKCGSCLLVIVLNYALSLKIVFKRGEKKNGG